MGPNFCLGRHTPTHLQGKNPRGLFVRLIKIVKRQLQVVAALGCKIQTITQ